jgi:hypothetical protein
VLLGGIVYLVRHGEETPDYLVFVGAPADLRGVSGIVADALTFSGRGIIQLGLLLLVATPVARGHPGRRGLRYSSCFQIQYGASSVGIAVNFA